MDSRLADTIRLYELLDRLAGRLDGPRLLKDCDGRMDWPQRGVYFFFEKGEGRNGSGRGQRIVRVGTHAIRSGADTTLWRRLRQHQGPQRVTARRRGSIFRTLVAIAIARKENLPLPSSWRTLEAAPTLGMDNAAVKAAEVDLECRVNSYIRMMPFLWVGVEDQPSPDSDRAYIERNAVALLGSHSTPNDCDRPSGQWLGHWSDRPRVRASGLWNNTHVGEDWDPAFLRVLERWVEMGT